jgi:hypothetical protein
MCALLTWSRRLAGFDLPGRACVASLWSASALFGGILSIVVGVAQLSDDPDSVSLVRGGDVMRSHNTPLRVIPHFGKISEDGSKSSSHKHW